MAGTGRGEQGGGERRTDALSKERIVDAAIAILDAQGESALTFRALAASLATGAGAIYWHVANKNELLQAAADAVITRVVSDESTREAPAAIRAIASGVFDAIDAHPWVGGQLLREPGQSAVMEILEGFGEQLEGLGVPERDQFNAASALVNYVLGSAGQFTAGARINPEGLGRTEFLARVATRWTERHDAATYPFAHRAAAQLREHDDREQFLAGIDILVAGISTLR
ncbi:TetR family transcriptional regulator [Glaciihabitans sp. dw_435]|uniref:TetR/AcrR family transcriptional regulator n=1 Tax=Glaciihabitans sp. dw_435 TaxID=2720081 RepID=UPI001BD60B13|nr:TetR family transcriptional regulator [Glaciihabitans sp. dw_435]